MAHPQVADRGDGLQIWRVAANIEYSVADSHRGGPPAWVLVEGLTTPHRKKKTFTKPLDKPRNWIDSLGDLGKRIRI